MVIYLGGEKVADLSANPLETLTFSTSLTWDAKDNPNAVVTVTDDVSSFSVTNLEDGGVYELEIRMDSSGGHDFPFPSDLYWIGETQGEVSSGANATDNLTLRRKGSRTYAILTNDWGTAP